MAIGATAGFTPAQLKMSSSRTSDADTPMTGGTDYGDGFDQYVSVRPTLTACTAIIGFVINPIYLFSLS